MRVAPEFRIFTNVLNSIVDPKNFDPKSFVEFEGDVCIVPPNSFALARSVEYFRIPRNVLTVTVGKSTYARCGIITNVTPFEPEWEGYVTLEISNTTPLPAKIYANEGIAQVLFFEGDEETSGDQLQGQGRQVSGPAGRDAAPALAPQLRHTSPPLLRRDRLVRVLPNLALALLAAAGSASAQDAQPRAAGDQSMFRRLDLPTPGSFARGAGLPAEPIGSSGLTTSSGDARYRGKGIDRRRADRLLQQLARHAALPLASSGPESLHRQQSRQRAVAGVQRHRAADCASSGSASRPGPRPGPQGPACHPAPLHRQRDHDAGGPRATAPSRWAATSRHFLDLPVRPDPEPHGHRGRSTARPSTRSRSGIPRLAVYDDVRGWNTEQYLGEGEFYLEYGSFDVSLTVPGNILVAATGTLRNPEQVLTPTQRARLAEPRPATGPSLSGGRTRSAGRARGRGGQPTSGGSPPTASGTSPGPRRRISSGMPVGVNEPQVPRHELYPPSADLAVVLGLRSTASSPSNTVLKQ